MMPSLFIAHGAPLLAIEDNVYTQVLSQLGNALASPRAVVLFSAHWVKAVQKVSTVRSYNTMYDFAGFPDALYQIRYPAVGDPELAAEIASLFERHGVSYDMDSERGLDHGAWVVLRLLYPNGDIPVISMSVNPRLKPEQQYQIGQSLQELRDKDILVIASGGTVHNLRALNWQDDRADDWAVEFDEWLGQKLRDWDLSALYRYDELAPNARLAVPPFGSEHFIPIFYAMGAADNTRTATLLHRSFRYGNLSQSVWQFG